jgi:hypothetical protein
MGADRTIIADGLAATLENRWGILLSVVLRISADITSEELAQNGARRRPVSGSFDGARRTLCVYKDNVISSRR